MQRIAGAHAMEYFGHLEFKNYKTVDKLIIQCAPMKHFLDFSQRNRK